MDKETDKANENVLPQEKKNSFLKEFIIPLVIGLIVVYLLRFFIFGLYYVPSGSMIPNLEINDHVFATKFSYQIHDPERYDVIVFNYPIEYKENKKEVRYVKRLMGLPNETIEIRNNKIYINGKVIDDPFRASDTDMSDFGPITIGENEFFMMGDNRNHSNDSRFWGTVPRDLLIGKVQMIYWPISRIGSMNK